MLPAIIISGTRNITIPMAIFFVSKTRSVNVMTPDLMIKDV